MDRELTEDEVIAAANETLTEFSEDWAASRCDFGEDIVEDLAVACQILWQAAGKPAGTEWLPLFRMLFEGKGVIFSVLAQQAPRFQAAMNAALAARKESSGPADAAAHEQTDFDLF
ncbi:hypothetical protein LGM38_32635 [Burkholderia vietnamiensis]|uniref:hypothetical protein n=1 Tax=Burkholderia vietnamiensis TaxID=60552 RepID=UPI001CF273EA|nr:hypothetical protein [Burkholderia vietnamiensis]MCA8016787.1 hypothetical protein [Burkholderia vietnamiensis]HDR8942805.1 hypothetical protein [Burkholderia vietnamiensis]HDR9032349.1 hypothetical protein [Burkholderia vietnamiensis]HDR9266354.1 hypothetical protein [Burkholderia vietnamiensis]